MIGQLALFHEFSQVNSAPIRDLYASFVTHRKYSKKHMIVDLIHMRNNQCGFVKGCSATGALHSIKTLIEKHVENSRK